MFKSVIRNCGIKSMAEAHLLRWNACDLRKTFVNKLRSDHGMLGFERISSSQGVILVGIDNDTSNSVDSAQLENPTLVHAEP